MERYHKINEIAKLFQIPVSTLHYWEKEGLFSVNRNSENQYRLYDLSDILNIWEVALYRELAIPVKDIKKIVEMDFEGLEKIYEEKETVIKEKLNKLYETLNCLQHQKEFIYQAHQLGEEGIRSGKPDFSYCQLDVFSEEMIRDSLDDPYRCCLLIQASSNKCEYYRGIQVDDKVEQQLIWEWPEHDVEYMEFLLKLSIENLENNNLEEIRTQIHQLGYETKDVIARYLLIATEEGTRYEFYKAWIEVTKKEERE